ncbi:ferredoxin--NADP reductase [Vibrio parahaemolyticus]
MKTVPNGLVKGRVLARKHWTEKLFSLEIKAPVEKYLPGQFTKLGLTNEQGEWVRRAYSMVNHPGHAHGHDHLEFLIIADDNGQLSPKLHKLRVGDEVYVGQKPSGFMTLDEIPDYAKDLWLLSTGTAIGPFISMLADPSLKWRFTNITLVHAVRTSDELVYQDAIHTVSRNLGDKFQYVTVVSREAHATSLQGRIPLLLTSGAIQGKVGRTFIPSESFLYICGNPFMVKDTSQTLTDLGLEKHLRRKPGNFASENYW